MSQTNDTQSRILHFFLALDKARGTTTYAERINIVGVPLRGGRGLRPTTGVGFPDIAVILPPLGNFIGIEVKTGKDRLSDKQKVVHETMRKAGATVLVVKTFEDFEEQFFNLYPQWKKN